MADTLETNRLTLRPWGEADVSLFIRLASDPQVVRYIGDGQRWSTGRINEVAEAVSRHWRRHGFGWRIIVPKGAQEPVGFVMLNCLGEGTARLDPDEFEIGWWLLPTMWRSAWQPRLALLSAARRSGGFEHRVSLPECSRRIAPLPPLRHVSACHTSSTRQGGSARPCRCIGSSRPS
jgi:hypothetical protein